MKMKMARMTKMIINLKIKKKMNFFSKTLNSMFSNCIKEEDFKNFNEIEFRFGKFLKTFKPCISKEIFYNIYWYCIKNYKHVKTCDNYTRYDGGKNKYIKNNTTNQVVCKKNSKKIDIVEYGIRVGFCKEEIVKNFKEEKYSKTIVCKNRTSFDVGVGNLDLTIYTIENSVEYHIELEVKNMGFSKFVVFILQHLQKNYYLTTTCIKGDVYKYIQGIFKASNIASIPSNVKTLQKFNIGKISSNYAVTNKLDGQRSILLCFNKIIYIIDTISLEVFTTDLKLVSEKSEFVLDGEFVIDGNEMCFHIFDILYYERDLRLNKLFDFKKRMGFIKSINIENGNFFKIFVKKYYFNNVFIGSKKILMDKDVKNDGLIYVPIDEIYKSSNIYKWKPVKLNTIDFYCVLNKNNNENSENEWILNVKTNNGLKSFDQIEIHDDDKYKEDFIKPIGKTSFDNTLLDPITKSPYETNTVIEFYWCCDQKKFMPLRTRWDKTANPNKYGNFETVAYDIWYNINNPIDEDFLTNYIKKSNNDLYTNFEKQVSCIKKNIHSNISKYKNYLVLTKDCNKNAFQILETNTKKYNNVLANNIEDFFESQSNFDEYMNILNTCLKVNGTISMSFIDFEKIQNLPFYKEYDEQIVYLKEIFQENKNTIFGNKFTLNYNTCSITENIVCFKYLYDEMLKNGFEMIICKPYSDEINSEFEMKDYEKEILSIYNYCSFKKKKNTKTKQIKSKTNIEKNNITEIEKCLESQEYRIVKISSSYELLDILNCIEYKYNIFDFENFQITVFQDVEKVFEMYNVCYTPLLIEECEKYTCGFINTIMVQENIHLVLFYETLFVDQP